MREARVAARIQSDHVVRVFDIVAPESGLTYSVSSGFDLRRHPGPFSVGTFTRVEEVRRILDLTLEEMARNRSEPPSEEELRDARALLVGSFSLGLETSAAVVGALVDLDVYGLPQDSLDRYRRKVRRTGADETTRIAKSHFHPERMAIALVGPAAAIVPQVEDLGPRDDATLDGEQLGEGAVVHVGSLPRVRVCPTYLLDPCGNAAAPRIVVSV